MSTEQSAPPIDYFDDDLKPVADEATLEVLTKLAQQSVELESKIAQMTVELEEKQSELGQLLRKRIPEIMKTLAMEEFKLTDGCVVSVKSEIKCGITEANKPAAFAWLEEHEFDGIIKTNVSVAFSKGEMEKAEKAVELLREDGFDAALDRSVHPSTLKSFVKERLEAGDNIPVDTFGIFEFDQAKVKLPKQKK